MIKTEGLLLSNSQFLMKRTKQKTTRPDNQQNRDQPELYRTKTNQNCYLKLGNGDSYDYVTGNKGERNQQFEARQYLKCTNKKNEKEDI